MLSRQRHSRCNLRRAGRAGSCNSTRGWHTSQGRKDYTKAQAVIRGPRGRAWAGATTAELSC